MISVQPVSFITKHDRAVKILRLSKRSPPPHNCVAPEGGGWCRVDRLLCMHLHRTCIGVDMYQKWAWYKQDSSALSESMSFILVIYFFYPKQI